MGCLCLHVLIQRFWETQLPTTKIELKSIKLRVAPDAQRSGRHRSKLPENVMSQTHELYFRQVVFHFNSVGKFFSEYLSIISSFATQTISIYDPSKARLCDEQKYFSTSEFRQKNEKDIRKKI